MNEDTENLRERFYLIYEFYKESDKNNIFILEEIKKLVDQAFLQNNNKALVKINKELDKMIRESSIQERKSLENRLLRLDDDIYLDESKRIERINRILKSGKIKNDKEYKLMLDRAEELYANDESIVEINKLLSQYVKRE